MAYTENRLNVDSFSVLVTTSGGEVKSTVEVTQFAIALVYCVRCGAGACVARRD